MISIVVILRGIILLSYVYRIVDILSFGKEHLVDEVPDDHR